MATFEDLHFSERLINTLKDLGYKEPTPIQTIAIPLIQANKDILGVAETGSGKTAAFSLPFILKQNEVKGNKLSICIIEPTKELAKQTQQMINEYTKFFNFFCHLIEADKKVELEPKEMQKSPHFLVGTANAFLKALQVQPKLLSRVSSIVLDEADKIFKSKHLETVKKVLYYIPKKHQTIMFTSTIDIKTERLAKPLLREKYEKLSLEEGKNKFSKPAETIKQEYLFIKKEKKITYVNEYLEKLSGSAIIFLRTQSRAEKVFKKLKEKHEHIFLIHGGKTDYQRTKFLNAFKENKKGVLITTDLAARGLDIPHVAEVINLDLPNAAETYIHRIGRTGRAGNPGYALSLVDESEMLYWERIQKLIRQRIAPIKNSWDHEVFHKRITQGNKEKALNISKKKRINRENNKQRKGPQKTKEKKKVFTTDEYVAWKKEKKLVKKNTKKDTKK